jgi:methyl-accepting chemotaxis protein
MKFKDLKLKNKIVLPVALILVLLITVLTVYTSVEFISFGDYTIANKLDAFSSSLDEYLSSTQQATYSAAFTMAENPTLIAAVESGDTQAILRYLTPYVERFGISYFTVADANGNALARTADPGNFGQNISNIQSIGEALRGMTATSYGAGGEAMLITCHSGSPIRNEAGEIIGALSAGIRLDDDGIVDFLGGKFNAQIIMFAGDTRVNTTIRSGGQREVGVKMSPNNFSRVNSERQTFFSSAIVAGEQYEALYKPLLNSNNEPFATVFVGVPRSSLMSMVTTMVATGIIIGVVGLVLAIVVLFNIANSIAKPLIVFKGWMHQASEGKIEGNKDDYAALREYTSRKDEIGEMTQSYDELMKYMTSISKTLSRVAEGDLTIDVYPGSVEDLLNHSLKKMLEDLNKMFADINSGSQQVNSGSQQISDGAQSLAQGSTEQAATVEELSASVSDIASKTSHSAGMARQAAALSNKIMQNAETGNHHMDEMVSAVNQISQSSQEISKVIKVIDDIAFQTNILALNAAVEAARAGQHGKGFAVVAEEVRNLAAKSAEAAKNTGGLIANSMEKAQLGASIAVNTASSLKEIVSGVNESAKFIDDIATSSEEQSSAIAQINDGIEQVANVVQQNSATAEQSAALAEELSGQSEMLNSLIASFKLRGM